MAGDSVALFQFNYFCGLWTAVYVEIIGTDNFHTKILQVYYSWWIFISFLQTPLAVIDSSKQQTGITLESCRCLQIDIDT